MKGAKIKNFENAIKLQKWLEKCRQKNYLLYLK